MFISNSDKLIKDVYVCGNTIGKYLIKKGVPILSSKDGKMVFAKTNELQKAIDNMPLYLKILVKGGVVNG